MSMTTTTLGRVSTVFADAPASYDEWTSGVTGGFAVISFRGKVWRVKYQGTENPVLRPDSQDPAASLEVILVKGSPHIAKIYYEGKYSEGDMEAPDCWSVNGIVPDPAAPRRQSPTCASCKQNVWGSRVSEATGKPLKACQDSRRIAVVPLGDTVNDGFGGPMLLRVPPASLGELVGYAHKMKALGYELHQIGTRLGFDISASYPKFTFSGIRVLTDEEAQAVVELRQDERVDLILATATEAVTHDPDAGDTTRQEIAARLFEQPPATVPAATVPASQSGALSGAGTPQPAQPQPTPAPAPQPMQPLPPAAGPTVEELQRQLAELQAKQAQPTVQAQPATPVTSAQSPKIGRPPGSKNKSSLAGAPTPAAAGNNGNGAAGAPVQAQTAAQPAPEDLDAALNSLLT